MKISLKIFIFTYCIMMIVTIFGGFLLIDYDYQQSLARAKKQVMEDNETLYMYVVATEKTSDVGSAKYSLDHFVEQMEEKGKRELYLLEYEELEQHLVKGKAMQLNDGEYAYSVMEKDQKVWIQVISKYGRTYMVNYYNVTEIMESRNQNYGLYRKIIIGTSIVIAAVLYVFSWYITRPLVKVTEMAKEISNGNYGVRIDSAYRNMKSQEVEQLGNTLNYLAENTEKYIRELKESVQKKEDFMGNFTHEMKTPMTSIIGYADLLRTYDLAPEKRRKYSNYIYMEGKRVEQLSLNLLQLIVMEKTDFEMEVISSKEIFEQLEIDVRFLAEKYRVNIYLASEDARIMAEKSLLLVAMKNVIDNACKASKEYMDIWVKGRIYSDEKYAIEVCDKGCGMTEHEMQRILEPFYMIDKSRARKQGGAGLGLSLCHKIIQLHGGELNIKSQLGKGTNVTVLLPILMKGEEKGEE